MAVQSLGYLGISTQNIDEWSDFATRQLGLQLVDRAASCRAFRMDDRRQRVIIDMERPDAERFFGWEVADAASLETSRGSSKGRVLPYDVNRRHSPINGLFVT